MVFQTLVDLISKCIFHVLIYNHVYWSTLCAVSFMCFMSPMGCLHVSSPQEKAAKSTQNKSSKTLEKRLLESWPKINLRATWHADRSKHPITRLRCSKYGVNERHIFNSRSGPSWQCPRGTGDKNIDFLMPFSLLKYFWSTFSFEATFLKQLYRPKA